MVQAIQASELTLREVETKFGLEESQDVSFFSEWEENLPELTDVEKQRLDNHRHKCRF